VRTEGPLAFNAIRLILNAALAGLGLTYLPENVVQQHVAADRLCDFLRTGRRSPGLPHSRKARFIRCTEL
jgi:DNA-binding transcriptional LysR family regulator